MKSISLLCVAFLSLSTLCQAQSWSLDYGNEEGKVAFYNSNNDPNFAEDSPYGPLSFRVVNNNLWVLDSVAGKLSYFDEKGKLLKSIVVPGLEGFKLLEDFALVGDNLAEPDAVWIANAADNLIRKISLADGKVIAQVGGAGDEQGKVMQVSQLETDAGGRLYVGDIARNKLSVFSATGAFLREYQWQSTGFVVDKYANLHLIHYSDNAGYLYRVYSPKGQLLKNTHLGFSKNANLKLYSVNADGSIILSMIPESGFKGVLDLYKVNKSGVIEEQLQYIPPVSMNRYVFVDGDRIFHAEADFDSAPKTKFMVKPLAWGKKASTKAEVQKSGIQIKKNVIAAIPDEITSNLVGLRVHKNLAYVMASNGKYITINLANGSLSNFKLKTSSKVVDYDVVVGKIIYLDDQGMICGHAFPKWNKGPYNACQIEACDQGAILSGGSNAYFLGKNATDSVELPEIHFSIPIDNGFLWNIALNKEKLWEVNLHDCFGNLMNKVYKFSEIFEPSRLEIGPNNGDGDLLVSAVEGNQRTLAVIGNNGRMFWKINGPEKICSRDAAFGPLGELLVLEKNTEGNIVLSRWTFITPEG